MNLLKMSMSLKELLKKCIVEMICVKFIRLNPTTMKCLTGINWDRRGGESKGDVLNAAVLESSTAHHCFVHLHLCWDLYGVKLDTRLRVKGKPLQWWSLKLPRSSTDGNVNAISDFYQSKTTCQRPHEAGFALNEIDLSNLLLLWAPILQCSSQPLKHW